MTTTSTTQMSLRTTLPLSDRKGPASNITLMNVQHDLNTQRIGMASRDPQNGLLSLKTLPMPVTEAITEISDIMKKKDDILDNRNLTTNLSANMGNTPIVAKTTISFHTDDLGLHQQQADLAQQLIPVLEVVFINRIPTNSIGNNAVATVATPDTKTTSITIDKPVDIARPAAYLAALLETKDDCERTQSVLNAHSEQSDLPMQLFNSAKDRIVSIIPDDKNALFALEALSYQSLKVKPDALVA